MIRTYKISGMTCVGCKTSIERNLNEVDQVITVEVDLEKEEAIINMSRLIEEEVLQKKLSSKYSISIKEDNTFFDYNKHSRFEIED
jgi:copper chaperone CopZ